MGTNQRMFNDELDGSNCNNFVFWSKHSRKSSTGTQSLGVFASQPKISTMTVCSAMVAFIPFFLFDPFCSKHDLDMSSGTMNMISKVALHDLIKVMHKHYRRYVRSKGMVPPEALEVRFEELRRSDYGVDSFGESKGTKTYEATEPDLSRLGCDHTRIPVERCLNSVSVMIQTSQIGTCVNRCFGRCQADGRIDLVRTLKLSDFHRKVMINSETEVGIVVRSPPESSGNSGDVDSSY